MKLHFPDRFWSTWATLEHIILTLNPFSLLLVKAVPLSEKNKLIQILSVRPDGDISNPRYTELEANTITVTLLRRLGNNNVHSLRFGRFRAVQRIYPRFANYWSNVLIFVIHHIRDVLQNMAKLDFRIDG